MKAHFYVDGFNLYYGALKGTPFKWLDLNLLFQMLFPKFTIEKIKYFTARVKSHPRDPKQPVRQQAYLRALQTLPNLDIVYGHFLSHKVRMPVADCPIGQQRYVRVVKTEEKGSDVNLAIHCLNDAFNRRFDIGVVVSNDSDLREVVRIITREHKIPIVIVNPYRKASRSLIQFASSVKSIRKGVLAASQFPSKIQDAHGTILKPQEW